MNPIVASAKPTRNYYLLLFIVVPLFYSSCSPLISSYDQYAYIQTTSLKVDALNLMDMATEDYNTHEPDVKEVLMKLDKVYEYEKNRAKNDITIKMWDIMKNPDRNLLAGFIKRWKNEKKLGEVFVTEAKKQVGRAFDLVAELEGSKIKRKDGEEAINNFINNN